MILGRLRAYLTERREAEAVPDGWSTPAGLADLAEIVYEVTGERPQVRPRTAPEAVYTPRHGAEGETAQAAGYQPRHDGTATQLPADFRLPPDYWTAERWRPIRSAS